jgi:hypothetical protein
MPQVFHSWISLNYTNLDECSVGNYGLQTGANKHGKSVAKKFLSWYVFN